MEKIVYKPGQSLKDYQIKRVSHLASINAHLIELVHTGTNAVHIHIANEDKENTFGVFFRTVPKDATGVAHVLEHTVLCGSEKYKVRDPFFSMIKRSLSTFMNALTASDWTMYPFSTQNKKDYYNLMDVYLDAAFFPNIDALSFKQEGHRLAFEANDDGDLELVHKGVVYNEMKGAMSSPDQVLFRALLKGLYPDTTYRYNSGGDPSDIPLLTHEGLKAFHAKYYHPSNAFFYTYGNLPLEDTLGHIHDSVLSRFDVLEMDTRVPSQPRWEAPRAMVQPYAYTDTNNMAKKFQGCVAWLTSDICAGFDVLVLTILEQILLGNSASPLRKALIDSELGTALSDGSGFHADNKDTMFVCGLKDIEASSVPKVEQIILETLTHLANEGIDSRLVDSAIHQIEFYRKEITNTPEPFGIKLLLGIAGTVIHGGDPVSCINIDDDLAQLKAELEKGPFLETKIWEFFINNPHRLLFTLKPDTALSDRQVAETRADLKLKLAKLLPAEIEKINADAKILEALQETEEDLSVLPTLELEDVPRQIEIIQPDSVEGVSMTTCYDKATSGILYFTCPVGAGNIPPELFPMVPFFCRAFTNSGTAKNAYVDMAKRMDLYTGGISVAPFSGTYFNEDGGAHSFLAIQGKALDRNADHLFDLMDEFINEYGFSDHERLKSLLLQYQAGLESSVVAAGHRYAITLSARHLSRAAHISELWHGIAQYKAVKALANAVAHKDTGKIALTQLSRNLTAIADALLTQNNLNPAVIGSADILRQADRRIQTIHERLSNGTHKAFSTPDIDWNTSRPYDGWYTNTAVSFVGQSFKTVRITHPDSPGLAVISKLLRLLYLHKEIREKGGAYGGMAMYNTEEGIFSFGSYRDPHIKRTLDVFADACDFIRGGKFTETDVKEAILQVCSDIDKPDTPGPAAMKAFYRQITKFSNDIRKGFKDTLLGLDKKRIQTIADTYFTRDDADKGIAVISAKSMLEQANQAFEAEGRPPLKLKKI
ncbi:MAG: peptidase M16 [Desulfobacterales bacterium]|nr:MAG: peptidase M16 [Desulfobacterales bacterium]